MKVMERAVARVEISSLARDVLLTTAGAGALMLMAQVSIPLPYTPVPITLQVLGVLLLAALYGPRLATATVVEYLMLGGLGLPMFTKWGAGSGVLFGVTGGYLMGFMLAACFAGLLYQRWNTGSYPRRLAGAFAAGLVGVAIIYLCGTLWLQIITQRSFSFVALWGIVPFALLDIVKAALVAAVVAARAKGSSCAHESR